MHHTNKEKFEEICELIKEIDANGDAIHVSLKLRTVSEKFRVSIKDEKLLSEIFDMFNARSLDDEEFILSLVAVITSRQLDSFTVNGKVLRHAMLSILQKNFQNADNFKRDNMNKFYNSIKLLGEFFNKARLSNGVPINIIGQSLLNLLNVELEKELRNICHLKNDDFAKLVLSQIALNGNLLKTRHRTEIEQLLFTIRKCLIELDSLTPKTKAFLIMSLDLYYSNFTNVGDGLEKMYQTFLLADMKVASRPPLTASVENSKVSKASEPGKKSKVYENGKVQVSMERMAISRHPDEYPKRSSSTPRNVRVQIRKPEPFRTGPGSSMRNGSSSPMTNGPASPHRSAPKSPQKTSPPSQMAYQSPNRRFASQSPSRRYASKSPSRYAPQSPMMKHSPQELRSKKSPPSTSDFRPNNPPPSTNGNKASPPRTESAIEKQKVQTSKSLDHEPTPPNTESTNQNGNDDNILRQQNSRSSTPSNATQAKYKVNSKVYFREENVENLTWNGETSFDGDNEDPDASTSPKVNPYSSSFLNFLSSN